MELIIAAELLVLNWGCRLPQVKLYQSDYKSNQTTTTVLQPFFQDHPVEPVPEENF